MCSSGFAKLTQLQLSRNRAPQLRERLHKTGLQASLWSIVLISDWHRKAEPTVGGAAPMQVVLRCLRRQTEQAIMKSTNSSPLWSLLPGSRSALAPILASLVDGLWWGCIRQINPSPTKLFGYFFFLTATEGKSERTGRKSKTNIQRPFTVIPHIHQPRVPSYS